jgi:TetR/AcrR family transcriptional regulator
MKKMNSLSSEEKVITAAIEEFAENGYAGARVDAIAKRADINKAMIYYYFKSKEMLYERILKNIADDIFIQVQDSAVQEGDPVEVFYAIIKRYFKILDSFDVNIFQIMLREIASGGKHFRKIAIPNLVVPVLSLVEPVIKSAIEKGRMRELNPYYTFLQIIGGIIFFNVIKIPMESSILGETVFKDDYLDEYRENLFSILKNGIELNTSNGGEKNL